MLHTNNTPLAVIGFEQWQPNGTRMAAVAARASFDVVNGVLRYAGEQKLVLADVFEGDPHRTPLMRACDLVPFRPEADVIPAAQIFSDTQPIGPDPFSPPAPEGFGPVPPWWRMRAQCAGTYDKVWKDTHHPLLPHDFDYRFYQVSPPGLRVPGYLAPGYRVQGLGLLPQGQMLDIVLPDVAPFAKFSFTHGREVLARLHMDGLHLDLRDSLRFDLTWRASAPMCPSFYRIDLEIATTLKNRWSKTC